MRIPLCAWAGSLFLACSGFVIAPACGKSPESSSHVADETVDLFAAIRAGDIEVKLFFKDATGGTAVVKNNAKKPLAIEFPDAFAGVPVAAQFMGGNMMGGNAFGAGNQQRAGGNQAVGGGIANGGGQNGNAQNNPFGAGNGRGNPFGPGIFNIEAGKERKLKIAAVCLEHGKEEPHARLAYDIRPLESFTDKPEVVEVVRMLGAGKIDQRTAQAAAWHLANGLSWKELAKKVRAQHLNGSAELFFTADEITRAQGYANAALSLAKDARSPLASTARSPSETVRD